MQDGFEHFRKKVPHRFTFKLKKNFVNHLRGLNKVFAQRLFIKSISPNLNVKSMRSKSAKPIKMRL